MRRTSIGGGYGDIAPTICADYYKAATSHFIRYTNGFAYPAVMEIYEYDSPTIEPDA